PAKVKPEVIVENLGRFSLQHFGGQIQRVAVQVKVFQRGEFADRRRQRGELVVRKDEHPQHLQLADDLRQDGQVVATEAEPLELLQPANGLRHFGQAEQL